LDFDSTTTTVLSADGQLPARGLIGDLLPASTELGVGMAEQVHQRIPELGAPSDERLIFEETEASCRSNIDQILTLLSKGEGPESLIVPEPALDYAQGLVRRQVPISVLLRGYRVGHQFLFNQTAHTLRAGMEEERALVSSLETSASFMFEYVDSICDQLVAAYHVERDRWVRSAAAVRAETARDLIDGKSGSERVDSTRLGYELERHHVGLILSGEAQHHAPGGVGSLERQAIEIAATLGCGDPLMIPVGASALWAWCGTFEAPSPQALAQVEAYRPPDGVRIAVGRPARGVEGFRVTHHEAGHAARFWKSGSTASGTATYRSIEVVSLLAADPERARRFVANELGPLAAQSEAADRLRSTLLGFLAHGCSHVHAAQALHMHQNTVYNRVRRAEELIGRSVGDHRVELQTALMLAESLGPEVLDGDASPLH
jgi:hypothetical protein